MNDVIDVKDVRIKIYLKFIMWDKKKWLIWGYI